MPQLRAKERYGIVGSKDDLEEIVLTIESGLANLSCRETSERPTSGIAENMPSAPDRQEMSADNGKR